MSGPDSRALIVNADDLGRSPGVNRGIATAHEHGIVTSASLMVRWPAAREAGAYGREHPDLSIGLHVDLGEWAFRVDRWSPVYEVDPMVDESAVEDEVARQLAAFRVMVGRDPTHLDSHQHVHREEPIRPVLIALAAELGVALRHFTPGVQYCGDFYGQTPKGDPMPEAITVDRLLSIFEDLPPGLTELGCHPGAADDLESSYRIERALEVEVLCDPRVHAAVADGKIELRSFNQLDDRWVTASG
jgi:chitin disaccharide deacetylase